MTNTLYIDLNSGKNRSGQGVVEYTIMQTVAHEMTHFIASNSKSGYATFQNLARKTLEARGQDFDAMVQHRLNVAERSGISLTKEGAVEEVMANASEMMLKDTKALQQLAQQNKSLADKVKAFVKDLLSKIRKALGGVSAKHPEARALMEAEQYVAGLQEAWDAALVEAVETVESSKTGETWNGIPVVEQFELREPVEKKGNLVATHAVSTQNLMNMLDVGTMVGLSLAVSHADSQASTKFGDNTLVFYASAIDPETNPDNHIFGFDAWTPRHPKAVYQKNEGAIQQTRNTYVKTMQDSGIDSRLVQQLGKFFDTHLEQQPADWIKTKNGNAQKVFNSPVSISGQNSGINALYLLENGVPAEQINEAYNENTRALIDMFQNNPQLMESLNQFKAKIASGFYEGRLFEQGITDTNDRAGSSLSDITVENTPDNALDIMKRQSLTDVGDSVGADGIRRKIPLVYNSLNEVRNDQGRLSINTNTTEEMLNAADSALAKFKNEVRIGKQSTAKIEGILQNAAANNLSDSDTVRALWKAGYIKANKKNVGEVMKAIQSFRNSPTNYFEAKLMRKSSFSEVAAAVVKESSTDLIARLKENGVRVLTYNGTVDDRIAKVNSVEEAKFSLRNPVETAGELVAVHNIKQDDLLATLRLGGFPMPSIAIIKGKDGHTMYGDYSVVFGKDTIDPQADKANKVYGADAWTPTFPPVETEIKHDVMYNVQQEMGSLAGQVDSEYAQKAKSWFGNFGGLDTITKPMTDIQDSAWNNSGMVAAYLADHGENVDILEKDVPVKRDYNPARASMYDKVLDIVPLKDIESMKARELLDTYGDQLAESIPRPFARLNTLWKDKDYDAGKRMLDFLRQAKSYENSGRDTSVQTRKEKDFDATYTAMKESIDRNDFNAWVAQKMQDAFGAQGIYNGKELFTPNGNRRNFKSLHNDLTVDNVVKSMLTQEESYIPPTNAKGLMAAASRMYKSIAEIKGDASRLGKISEEEYIAEVAHADNMYHDFLNAIEAWDANEIEDVGELLVKAAKQQMNASAISTLFKRNGYSKATLNASKMAKQLIDTVQNIPTGYFEAKPRRVVDFNEIRMVIAPDTMGSELENALTERNIPYTTYAANDEADRLAKLNSLEDVKFSLRDSSGNVISMSEQEVEENKRYVANMDPVVSLVGNPMQKDETGDFYTKGVEYFKSIGGSAVNPTLGEISLNEKGIRHLINRRLTWRKTALLRAVKPVIENGRILHVENEHNGKDTAIIAATVNLDRTEYYMGVVVSQNNDMSNTYEVHDAVIVEKRKEGINALTKTPSADNSQTRRGDDNPHIAIILSELADYNTEFQERFSLRPQTDTPEFQRWFGDSEVVDDEGNPLVVYHTTDSDFTMFDSSFLGSSTDSNASDGYLAATAHVGFWFNTQDLTSKMGGSKAMPVYLSSQRMYEVGTLDALTSEIWDAYTDDYDTEDPSIESAADAGESYRRYLESRGYDGIMVTDTEFGGTSYVVFDPEQIKSATDNIGTFDPNNPDIRYSLREETEADLTRQYLETMETMEITDSMSDSEKWLLGKYQRTQADIAEKETLIAEQDELKAQATSRDERVKAENRAKTLREQVKRLRNSMRSMERSDGFGSLMRRSEAVVERFMRYDDVTQTADLSDQLNQDLNSLNSQLESVVKTIQSTEGAQRAALARGMLNEQTLAQAGKNVRETFGTRMSGKEISNRLALAYAELYATEGEQGVRNFANVMRDLARDVLRRSNRRYQSATLNHLRENLQGSIGLTDAQKQELKNAGISQSEFKRMMSGVVNVSEGGTSLASIVSSAEYYGSGIISQLSSTDSEGDMILKLYNLVQTYDVTNDSIHTDGVSSLLICQHISRKIEENCNFCA